MTFYNFLPLESLARVQLAHLPTPIDPLPNLAAHLGGPELFIKRDDQTGLAMGGNKTRKLEFLIAQALVAEADTIITAGSMQSNHARQTAAAAARYGLGCHLVLRTPDGAPPRNQSGNILLSSLLGATLHWTDEHSPYTETMERVKRALLDAGRQPYIIPYGGSNPYGIMGYVAAMREFKAQARGLEIFDTHVFATSSGGTQAGMILGAHMANLDETTRILGISVDATAGELAPRVAELANGAAERLGMDWRLDPYTVLINDDYISAGYAVVGEPEREAIRLMAQHEGILLDPVYTGRAFAGLIDLIRRGELTKDQRVLFWHTGGTSALFAFANALL
jgi:D-cysteine desulfhydrase family pyridoxal phosphate-dependent enzyme